MSCGCSQSNNMVGGGKLNLNNLTCKELKSLASKLEIKGRSKLTNKFDLITAIRKKNILTN